MNETPHSPMIEAVAYARAAELVGPPTLDELYEAYMDSLEKQIEAEAAARAALDALRALPEYAAMDATDQAARAALRSANEALAAVKAAVANAFQETGDKQPHPYAGVLRIERRARYSEHVALRWLKERPDYQHLIVPEAVDKRGFEKLLRALEEAGCAPSYDDGSGLDVPVVEWDKVPVVRVSIRCEEE